MRDLIIIAGLTLFVYCSIFESDLLNSNKSSIKQIGWLTEKVQMLDNSNFNYFVKETISEGETFYEIEIRNNDFSEKETIVEIFDIAGNLQFKNTDIAYQGYQEGMTYEKIILNAEKSFNRKKI